MFEVQISDTETKHRVTKKLVVVDAHSHVGADEEKIQNLNPMAASGTIDFYKRIYHKYLLEENKSIHLPSSALFNVEDEEKEYEIKFSAAPSSLVKNVLDELAENCKCGLHKSANEIFENSWLIDLGVIFPFHDTFRNRMPEAEYRASNINIHRNISSYPGALRFIGFMRLNPQMGIDKVKTELDFGVGLGLRGVKLHPRSDLWLDDINTDEMVSTMVEAARRDLPVILDTRGRKTIDDIFALVNRTLPKLGNIPGKKLKVIIAHCAHGYIGDKEVYDILAHPNIYGEISMLHGDAVKKFYKEFANHYKRKDFHKKTGIPWSKKILFGSDFPFLQEHHALYNLQYLTSESFFTRVGTLNDLQNILGKSLLDLLRPKNDVWKEAKRKSYETTAFYSSQREEVNVSSQTAEQKLSAELVSLFEEYSHITHLDYLYYNDDETKGDISLTFRDKAWSEFCECNAIIFAKDHLAALTGESTKNNNVLFESEFQKKIAS
ncbi:MAG: amidohydrolase family protein [Candidatus Heimdallarchaeota archaeon]